LVVDYSSACLDLDNKALGYVMGVRIERFSSAAIQVE
jgi:hypothetical protein